MLNIGSPALLVGPMLPGRRHFEGNVSRCKPLVERRLTVGRLGRRKLVLKPKSDASQSRSSSGRVSGTDQRLFTSAIVCRTQCISTQTKRMGSPRTLLWRLASMLLSSRTRLPDEGASSTSSSVRKLSRELKERRATNLLPEPASSTLDHEAARGS